MNRSTLYQSLWRCIHTSLAALSGVLLLHACGGSGGAELTTARQAINKAENQKITLSLQKDSAKIAKAKKDIADLYKTAYTNLQVEVQKGSTSANIGEAWFLLGKTSKELDKPEEMKFAFKQAEQFITGDDKNSKQWRSEISSYLFESWANGFNKGVELYNTAIGSEDEQVRTEKFKEAIAVLRSAAEMKPENADIYPVIAGAYQNIGDTANALATYERYIALHQPAINFLSSKGVLLSTERSEALSKLGTPQATKGVAAMPDTVVMDKYPSSNGEVLLFYPKNKEDKFTLEGFKVGLPASWADYERERYVPFDNRINYYTAINYYFQKNYDKALQYADNGLLLQPSNEDLLNLQAACYTEGGKLEQAMAAFKDRITKNPNDKNSLLQYGSMLSNAGKIDEAIDIFKKVLAIDPKSELAIFNLGAALKNKAGAIQKEEQEKFDKAEAARKKDKKVPQYVIDNSKYFPYLKESAQYFEQYRKLPGKDRDLQVLSQLLNTYEVIDDKENYRLIAGQIASLEYANEKNPAYYETMGRIYAKQKRNDKAKEAFDKADALRKAGVK
ncbi:MAG: tetratricopeptide repeat protein [Candidatus Kapabacteria bacterium]|nr:tetratricopeptide repeat protein [Candidatus Kapabacteria bacterium]